LLQALGLDQLVIGTQVLKPLLELFLDPFHGVEQGFAWRYIVALGVEGKTRHLADDFASQRVKGTDAFDFVIEQLDAYRLQIRLGRVDVDHITAHAEGGAGKIHVVAGVLQVGQAAQQLALVEFVAAVDVQHHFQIGLGAAQAIDA